jgi:serine/threonine protein kinase, bacterial
VNNPLLSNRYQIIQTLGSGGFGETFLAEDTHMPSRRSCVVKRLRPVQHNPQINQLVQERFQREAAILEELGNDHRQIPELYAYFYGQTDQQFYLVQEWIDGDTLSSIIHLQGRLAETEVRRLLIAILPVFDYVHRQAIIHRDVKPENIIVRRLDQQPVLIDFGAVRETMGTALNSQGRPTQSIIIGTPGYMASEQSIGRPVYSSDLYSLGLTAIYLLTGREPQEFITNPNTSEILWRSAAPQLSPELADILDKAIASHPRDRYQTAPDFLAALQCSPTEVKTFVAPKPVASTLMSRSRLLLMGGVFTGMFLGSVAIAALFLQPRQSEVTTVTVNRQKVLPEVASSISSTSTAGDPTRRRTPRPSIQIPSAFPSPLVNNTKPTSLPINLATASITEYYQNINNRDYQAAWQLLPLNLQANTTVHPQGYDSFMQWWSSVATVQVDKVQTIQQTAEQAQVRVHATYLMENGQTQPFSLRYILAWDETEQKWAIEKIRRR